MFPQQSNHITLEHQNISRGLLDQTSGPLRPVRGLLTLGRKIPGDLRVELLKDRVGRGKGTATGE